MRKIKNNIKLIVCMLISINSYGQLSSSYFYYYRGEKILLDLDNSSISISLEGDNNLGSFKKLYFNGKTPEIIEDHSRKTHVVIDQSAKDRRFVKTYYSEIKTAQNFSEPEYRKKIEEYRKMPEVLMASPNFKTKGGKKIGLSNNFYVKLKDSKDVTVLYENAKKMNIEVLGHDQFMPLWFTLSCGKSTTLNAMQAANLFYETGLFEITEPAFMYHDLLSAPNDPFYNNQWGLKNTGQYGAGYAGIDIHAEQAWTVTTGSTAIKTAIFDHGFEMNHPDLSANVFGTGYDAETSTSPSQVRGDHGTACAGITSAVQNNSIGVSGVAPTSKIISISINLLFSNTPSQLAAGFNWAWQNGADVISNSWGGYTPSSIIENAITNALTNGRGGKGTVIVFAAGNENNTQIRYPGIQIPLILVVGALSPCGERKNPGSCDGEDWGSCYGTQLDIMAPGVKIPTTDRQGGIGYDPTNYYQSFNGTSSACPNIAGVAALVLSVNPNLTVQQVNDIIEQSAQKVRTDLYSYTNTSGRPNGTWNNEMGYGLVNAHQAVLSAVCLTDISITTNVISPNVDNRQASNSITATNIIFSGAKAVYHGGNYVLLNPGFEAANGSVFAAYIEGCTGNYQLRTAPLSKEEITYDWISNNTDQTGINDSPDFYSRPNVFLQAFPNPSAGVFTLDISSKDEKNVIVYDATGKVVFEKINTTEQSININITQQPQGIYLVRVIIGNEIISKKVSVQ